MNRLICGALLLVVVGCDRESEPKANEPPATATKHASVSTAPTRVKTLSEDPAASFKAFAVRYLDQLKAVSYRDFGTVEIDVQKTNSLITPYTGTLKLTASFTPPSEKDQRLVRENVLSFAAQDERWVFKSFKHRTLFQHKRNADLLEMGDEPQVVLDQLQHDVQTAYDQTAQP